MHKFTGNYCYSNSNFIITKLPNQQVVNKYTNIIRVVQNLITRGNPTIASVYIRKQLKLERDYINKLAPTKFLSSQKLDWIQTIKGDNARDYFPAYKFYEDLDSILKSVGFLRNLVIAEYPIQEILKEVTNAFHKQKVDFYIPLMRTVIEIDGKQHTNQSKLDKKRDDAFKRYGVHVIRISTSEIQDNNYEPFKQQFRLIYREYKSVIDEYGDVLDQPIESIENQIILTSIARFQVFILELLDRGILSFDSPNWNFYVSGINANKALELALADLERWISNIAALFNEYIDMPHVNVFVYDKSENIPKHHESINVNFDLFRRWDDTCNEENIYHIRTDYDDRADYFQVKYSDPVVYSLDEGVHARNLSFILENLYGYKKFNNGQLSIITNCLNGEDTIGLLPTGGGKSLIYQICVLLQPAISFVVVPIKSLMLDQVEGLAHKHFITHASYINSDLEAEESSRRLNNFSKGKYFFILISPERFQSKKFREELELINRTKAISIAVIDEVHCLSEWGHDFRTSYLALANTIRLVAPSVRYLALTATASSKVLQDVMNELEIASNNVLTIPDFNRSELDFEIKKVDADKRNEFLLEFIKQSKEKNKKSGCLVFTQTVGGKQGCYPLSSIIEHSTGYRTMFYSGKPPKDWDHITSKEFAAYKDEVQRKFMDDEIDVLVATKSFGMGIDKGNVRLTVHYGLPASLESFYQEAGRAGRDKKKSSCKVLYVEDKLSESQLNVLFGLNTNPVEIATETKNIKGDLSTLFFLMRNSLVEIQEETDIVYFFYSRYAKSKSRTIEISYGDEIDRANKEKYIYRLALVGVFTDWTIDYKNKTFEVTQSLGEDESLIQGLNKHIQKYDYTFDLLKFSSDHHVDLYNYFQHSKDPLVKRLLYVLIKWTNDNVVYSRKRSMLLMKEYAETFISSEDLQEKIEQYFKRNDDVYFLENIVGKREKLKDWFRIFFVSEIGKGDLPRPASVFKSLRVTLSRFLESYNNDIALNLINGLISLASGDFEKVDGRKRLTSALKEIIKLDELEKQEMFDSILRTSDVLLSLEQKNELSDILITSGFNKMDELKKIQMTYDDYPSFTKMVGTINESLLELSPGGFPWEK